jgi:uncharacterized membrane protein
MEFGSIGNHGASLSSLIKSQLNSIGVLQRAGRSGSSVPFTPLPKLAEPSASQPNSSSPSANVNGSTISALSIEIKLLNVSFTSGSSSGSNQNSADNTQIDLVRQELKLFRAEIKHSLKQELGEIWEQLPSEARGDLRGLFKQFTREVRHAFREARQQRGEEQSFDLEALSQQLHTLFDQFLSDLKQTLSATKKLQADRVDALAGQLTSLFDGLIDRLAPARPAPEPQVEPVEAPAAETPESSPETAPAPAQPEPARPPREGSLAYQTISLISISASYQSLSIRA